MTKQENPVSLKWAEKS